MGDIADQLINDMIDQMFDSYATRPNPPKIAKGEWVDTTGKLHTIIDMNTSHVIACMRFCARNGMTEKEQEFGAELERRSKP